MVDIFDVGFYYCISINDVDVDIFIYRIIVVEFYVENKYENGVLYIVIMGEIFDFLCFFIGILDVFISWIFFRNIVFF